MGAARKATLGLVLAAALPAAGQQLAPYEGAPAGQAIATFVRTGGVVGGGMLNTRLRIDGRETCFVERKGECRVALAPGSRTIEVDNPTTSGTTSGTLEVVAGQAYQFEIDSRVGGLFGAISRANAAPANATAARFALTRNGSNFSLTLKAAGDAPAAAPPPAADWDTRIAILAQNAGKLSPVTGLVVLFDVPAGAPRERLSALDARVRQRPISNGFAIGRAADGSFTFSTAANERSGFIAGDAAATRCVPKSLPGSCAAIALDGEASDEGIRKLADYLKTGDYAQTRAAFLETLARRPEPTE